MLDLHFFIGGAIGFVSGAFVPSVTRRIKAFFVKETTAVKPSLVAGIGKIESAAKADIKKL